MAECIEFTGINRHFNSPLAEPEIDLIQDKPDLYAFNNGIITYTRWRLSPEEIMEIAKTGEVWLAVRNGAQPMRPTWLGSMSNVMRSCLDYGRPWRRPRPLLEDKREPA